MNKPKKQISDPIAARAIAIDGTHFAQGEKIKDVPQSEIDSCIRLGSVVSADSSEGQAALLEAEQRAEAAAATEAPAKKG